MKKFCHRKRSLTKALEQAVARWISAFEDQQFSFEEDRVEAIDGLLSHLDWTLSNFNMRYGKSGRQGRLKIYLVDTNIFLEVLLSQERKTNVSVFLGFLRIEKKME